MASPAFAPAARGPLALPDGVDFVLVAFVDLFGRLRSKLVPRSAAASCCKSGAGFAGFAAWFDVTPAHPDVLAFPVPATFLRLPWKPEIGWCLSELEMGGRALAQSPRGCLDAALRKLREQRGWTLKVGVECEFFLLDGTGTQVSDPRDVDRKPCYDQDALLRRLPVIAELCTAIEQLGWKPYQCDHEDANGQYEINWEFDDALLTADRVIFFKHMAKQVAAKHGFRATFMPKPLLGVTGSGGHMHVTVHDAETGKNLFEDKADKDLLSPLGKQFIAGVLAHGPALCAVHNPTVNSYKRLHATAAGTQSGATWSPTTFSWGGNDRTVAVRVPDFPRFELRLPDLAANPYLAAAALLAAGLDGVDRKLALGEKKVGPALPLTLGAALDALEQDSVLAAGLGADVTRAYLNLKREHEVAAHYRHLSQWEVDNTLDC